MGSILKGMKDREWKFMLEVCGGLDISLLSDIEPLNPDDESDMRVRTCVALGERSELGAGLRGYSVTPWFPTMEELEAFCQRHIERFRAAMGACEQGGAVPDATNWDEEEPQDGRMTEGRKTRM